MSGRAAGGRDRAEVPDAGAGPRRVGALLREARERRGLSLEEAASATRFPPRQVRAVEEGSADELPPQPYARGLLAAYAALVGLDAGEIVREWGLSGDGGPEGSIFRVPLRAVSSWRDWTVPIACACAAAAYLVLGVVQRPAPVEVPDRPAAPPAAERPLPQPEQEEAAPAPDATAPDAAGLTVVLHSEGSSRVDVAADAEEVRRQDLGPGQELTLRARRRLGLSLGDAGAVRITVNGRELGFIGDKGEARAGVVFEAPAPGTSPRAGSVPGR
ncbi:MAG TPA: helix-turn-helix domain-containing protein [bacterium]